MSIEIRNVSKNFGDFKALKDVSLTIDSGELVALLGPSGCGKTTLLRIIAGLETADAGSILFSGEDTTGVHVRERQVGFVFQHYALFRHMSVFENVAFGLRVKPRSERPSQAKIRAKVMDLLELVQLDSLADRYPHQLSGGQRQRVMIAMALANEPDLLIADEPTTALDVTIQAQILALLRDLRQKLGLALLLITHDLAVVAKMTERVCVMRAGEIVESGATTEVFERPRHAYTRQLLEALPLPMARSARP